MEGSATLTIETSSTTMNCATQAIVRTSQSGAWRCGAALRRRRCAAGLGRHRASVRVARDARDPSRRAPDWRRWPPSSSSPCATCDASTRRTARCCAGINLSFYPGAKIGVIGANGSGKSSLLRDHGGARRRLHRRGPAHPGLQRRVPAPGAARSTRPRTSSATSPTASATQRDLLARFDEVCAAFADPDADFDALLAEQADLQTRIDAAGRLGPRTHARDRDGRAAPAAGRRRRDHALGRRASPRRAVPAAAVPARPAAARRADEPPRRRVGGVARAHAPGLHRHRRRRHPRPLLPRQRRVVDPRARSRARHPLGGQLLVLARAEAGATGRGGEGRRACARRRSSASSSGSACRRAPARARARPG